MSYSYLDLAIIEQFVPRMRAAGVSAVARGPGGFLSAYRAAGGDPAKLTPEWQAKREAFIARHAAQAERNGEELMRPTGPSRRHLALIAWAYSPTPAKLRRHTDGTVRGMRVQTLLFDPDLFSKAQATSWARRHGFLYGKVADEGNYWRVRQADPRSFVKTSFRTIDVRSGVKAVVARPK